MAKPMMARADFISALVFFLLGVYMVYEGYAMPDAGGYIEAGGEPGRVPVLLGYIISLLALVLLVRSVRSGGHRRSRTDQVEEADTDNRRGAARGLLTAVWCSFYALGLIGAGGAGWTLSYPLATLVFLFVFIVGFEWEHAAENAQRTWLRAEQRLPSVTKILQRIFAFVSPRFSAYIWLIATASAQASLVTWAVTYLFEQKFYVKLP